MTNAQCATCHQQPFTELATSHPEFDSWPVPPETAVDFPHAIHAHKHFPEAKQTYDCKSCHDDGTGRDIVTSRGYELCGTCHDQTIRSGTREGLVLLRLPMIERQAFQRHSLPDIVWPATSDGSFDGELVPWMQWLLLADETAAPVLRQWGVDWDFLDVDSTDPMQVRNARIVVAAIQRLAREIADDPTQSIQHRLQKS
ncbi:MAG: cytochrome c3 family protein, partial [Planctomycetales bacterium]|nr:cytochrome c3 family protein [Planctomycetales bacterium]